MMQEQAFLELKMDKFQEYACATKELLELKIRKVEADVRWLKTSRQTFDLNALD